MLRVTQAVARRMAKRAADKRVAVVDVRDAAERRLIGNQLASGLDLGKFRHLIVLLASSVTVWELAGRVCAALVPVRTDVIAVCRAGAASVPGGHHPAGAPSGRVSIAPPARMPMARAVIWSRWRTMSGGGVTTEAAAASH